MAPRLQASIRSGISRHVERLLSHRLPLIDASIGDASRLGPHASAHLPAIRSACSMAVPVLILYAMHLTSLAPWAVFGGFAASYGRGASPAARAGTQALVGAIVVASIAAGLAVSTTEGSAWLAVALGSVLAAVVGAISVNLRWLPPGPLFPLVAFSVAARAGGSISLSHFIGPVVSASSAVALSVLIGALIGRQRRRDQPVQRVAGPNAEAPGGIGGAKYGVTAGLAGALAISTGFNHAYWAMFSAVVPFMASGRGPQFLRAVHRIVGTLLGLVVAAGILSVLPQHGLAPLLLVIILQAGAELFIIRHYGIAVVMITPLVLVMAQTVDAQPVAVLLLDRTVQTVLGVGVAVMVIVTTGYVREMAGKHRPE
jgi:hypothetical protein